MLESGSEIAGMRNNVSLTRVLLVEEDVARSAPVLSLAAELNRLGVETLFSGDALNSSTRRWLKLALQSQAVVFIAYRNYEAQYFRRQLQRTRLLGCVVVRWWVGSDVFFCLKSEAMAHKAREVDRAVDLNIAVSPHLVAELKSIGIEAEYAPSPCDLASTDKAPGSTLPRGVLTYLPTKRRAFYGERVVTAAIEANPDLEFLVVNDESHSLGHYPNVSSLGWVDDMEHVWAQAGMLLRVTEHDGLPRMVLEALARSRYVIYSQHLDGCWFARSNEEVLQHLERFKSAVGPNNAGPSAARFAQNAGALYVEKIGETRARGLSAKRLISAMLARARVRFGGASHS